MRNFTKPLAALLLGFVYTAQAQTTQTVEDDFEGNGTITNWYGDDCGLDTDKANPVAEGDNTSATVLEYSDTGGQYANVQFTVPAKFNLSETHTFSLRIYVPSEGLTGSQNNQVSLKLQNADLGESWTTQSEIIKDISLDSWQTVTFDFANDEYVNFDPTSPAPTLRSDFDKVVLQVNGEDNNDHVLAYVDDFLWDGTLTITDDGGDDGGNGGEDDGDEGDGELDSIPMHDEFKYLVWSDEFDGDGALDPEKWHHQTQLPEGGSWFNGEIQHYTNRTENSYQADGNLNLVLKRENFTDQGQTKTFTSARLNSKFAFTYGRVEVRAILPEGVGTWPAIWMLGKNINEAGAYWQEQGFGTTTWPACGEIDIMEHWGDNQDFVQAAIHTPSSFGGTVNKGGRTEVGVSEEFHIYTADWYPNRIEFGVDGRWLYTYGPGVRNPNTWPFNLDQYIILNIAVLGSIDPNFTEDAMVVDYVRVYQDTAPEDPDDGDDGDDGDDVTDIPDTEWAILNVYPNPVRDVLYLSMEETTAPTATVQLFTPAGVLVQKAVLPIAEGQVVWQGLESLPSGLYFLDAKAGNQRMTTKLIKD